MSNFFKHIIIGSGAAGSMIATELIKSNLCEVSSNSEVKLTSEGENLQFKMGLQTKVLNKIKIEGVEAEAMISDMLAKLESI